MYKKFLDTLAQRLLASRWRVAILKKLLALESFIHRWISTFSIENGLHPKHRLTKYHHFFTKNVSASDRVLDIGCGNGAVASDVAAVAAAVTGIDFDAASIREAQQKYRQDNLRFIVGDATTLQFDQPFTVIMMSNVLEHIEDRIGLLKKIKPLAKKFLIRVPMLDRDWLPLLKQELGLDYRLDPTHTIEFTEKTFRQELGEAGFAIEHLHIRFGEIYCVATPAP